MRRKKIWNFWPLMFLIALLMFIMALISLFFNPLVFAFEGVATLMVLVIIFISMRNVQRDVQNILSKTARGLDSANKESLDAFPLPVAVSSKAGELVWYNERFRESVLSGRDLYGQPLRSVASGLNIEHFTTPGASVDLTVGSRKYTVYGGVAERGSLYVLYWVDNTELKDLAYEYNESRPAVAIIMIDNYDDLMQNAREGEKADVVSAIEKHLLQWVSETTGFLRHSDRDKYIFIFEERHYRKIVADRFNILDRVRQVTAGDRMPATLSIGVGHSGNSLAEDEEMARQALDMALGRGGDQAAVKTRDGYEFYGGVSKAVEKRTKVKTRIIASALAELIDGSDNVLIMGHRQSDLDVLGACIGLYKAVESRGGMARIAIHRQTSMASHVIEKLEREAYPDAFMEPEEALQLVTKRSLLIVVDTHRKGYVDSPELYEAVSTVAVIDHHRKMVDFIDNAVIFHHEPYASSASEMVAELTQYLADSSITSVEADAMLAGITLDTRNFTIRTGVRTFEAAAYLKRKGADTARVKLMFAGSMENYRKRARLVASAEVYRNCAIAVYDGEEDEDMKIVAAQAADELLTITGISASMVICPSGGGAAISARSMGSVNMQLIMESLGGGGHLTMAGAQINNIGLADAKMRAKDALDQYFKLNKPSGEK